jgi:uncharacterized protein
MLMMAASVFLFYCPGREGQTHSNNSSQHLADSSAERNARFHPLSYNVVLGAAVCFFIGYITSLLGVGGGFIEVPAMVYLLNFPVHIATATSQFIVAVMAFTGSATHIAAGLFHRGIRRTTALAIGVILGAQLGAWLSSRLRGVWLMRGLAIGLGFVGIWLILTVL